MAKPIFTFRDTTVVNGHAVRVATFEIPGGVTTPGEFAEAVGEVSGSLTGEFGVIFDGRGPVWGFAMLVHAAHPTRWVACRDPRLGAIVVTTHDEAFVVGQIVEFPAE